MRGERYRTGHKVRYRSTASAISVLRAKIKAQRRGGRCPFPGGEEGTDQPGWHSWLEPPAIEILASCDRDRTVYGGNPWRRSRSVLLVRTRSVENAFLSPCTVVIY